MHTHQEDASGGQVLCAQATKAVWERCAESGLAQVSMSVGALKHVHTQFGEVILVQVVAMERLLVVVICV
jgi:hypothetical protein